MSASLCCLSTSTFAKKKKPELINEKKHWVDSVYNSLTLEERIGQLFTVAAYSGGKGYNEEAITKLLQAHQLGGLTFMQGTAPHQAALTNKYQKMAQVPLLISMDAEWGLGMRLDSVKSFPRQMMLGAADDSMLVYTMGTKIAEQCKRMGVHIDFAPDIDVNNNPGNPVINSRSFGEDKTRVARLGKAYMHGLQNNGVVACGKHFPGHGDTNTDSHLDLPVVNKSLEQLDSLELYPFKELVAEGVNSIMVAHLNIPSLDTTAHVPTSLSANAVKNLLREKLGFNGLIFTDALGMSGVTKYFPSGEADLRAFIAGNDVLLFSQDVPTGIAKIKAAIDSNIIPMESLEKSVKKILHTKYYVGLTKFKEIDTVNATEDLNKAVEAFKKQASEKAITVVRDDNQVLRKINQNMSIAYLGINADKTTPLYEALKEEYPNMKAVWLPKTGDNEVCRNVLANAANYDAIIVGIHKINFVPNNNYGLNEEALAVIRQAAQKKNTMIINMGNAYAMQYYCDAPSVMVTYDDDSITEVSAAEILLKKHKAYGHLPVTTCVDGKSVVPVKATTPVAAPVKEVAYDLHHIEFPVDAGVVDPTALDKLNLFMQRCIVDGAFPGCRILAARDGKIFFDKAYGYTTFEKNQMIDTETLYDMASCTKMLATNISVMKLYDEGKLDLDKTLGDYLPLVKGTDKSTLKIRDILLHQAGLKAWIPFYKETLNNSGKPDKDIFHKKQSEKYSVQVTEKLFMRNDFKDTVWKRILASGLDNKGKSVYSDLDFMFLGAVVEQLSGKPLDQYVNDQFYKPMGLKRITFNPLKSHGLDEIAPTEMDMAFRNQLVYGYVHDPGAAMMGGVAGHAGIFSSAHDAAVIFQMLLNKGTYGGKRYFKSSTVDLFTAYSSTLNHRGLGFDKPATSADDGGPAGVRCSGKAFGHQGFTGTCVWADPETGIVFVFQSNRVYPSAENSKINKMSVRTLAQDYIYEALGLPVVHDREKLYKTQVKGK